jgi:hypothetical protein
MSVDRYLELTYDNWRQADVRADENFFFIFLWRECIFGHSETVKVTVYVYLTPLVGCTVKTNTTDIQTVDSFYSKTIHQEMEQEEHMWTFYYNGKQVLCTYIMIHFTSILHVRNEDERSDTYTYMLRWYIRIYTHFPSRQWFRQVPVK